jgi:hypothetical protein
MARGYPDYQNPVNQVAGRLVDFSSIVTAQLGLASLDGLGRLFWWDTFAKTLSAWDLLPAEGDLTPVIDTDLSEIPPSCVKYPLEGGEAEGYSSIRRSFLLSNPNSVGVDCSFYGDGGTVYQYLQLSIYLNNYAHVVTLGYDQETGEVTLSTVDGDTLIYTFPSAPVGAVWIPFKLVVDCTQFLVTRALVGIHNFAPEDYTIPPLGTVSSDYIMITLGCIISGETPYDNYLGHVYVTTDEP